MSNEYDDLTLISFTCRNGACFDGEFQGKQIVTIDLLRKKLQQNIYFETFFDEERPLYIREAYLTRGLANSLYELAVAGDCHEWVEYRSDDDEADWEISLKYGETLYTTAGHGAGPEKSQPLIQQVTEWFDADYPLMWFEGCLPAKEEQDGLKLAYQQMMRIQATSLAVEEQRELLAANEKKNQHKGAIFYDAADAVVQKLVKRQEFTGDPDYEMVEFVGTFLYDFQMSLDGFREDVAKRAYIYGFHKLMKTVLTYETIQKKDFFQMITDGLNLATQGQQALIEKEMIPVVIENLYDGVADCSNALQHPAFSALKKYYLSPAELEPKAEEGSEFAEIVLYEGADEAVAGIFEWLMMFDTVEDENKQAFQEELAHTAISELGYDPRYWDANDFEFLGGLLFDGALEEQALTLEEIIQAAGCLLLTINFLGGYPQEEQVIPLVKALLTGYNSVLADQGCKMISIPADEAIQAFISKNESKEIQELSKQMMAVNRAAAVQAEKKARKAAKKEQEKKLVPAKSAQITLLEEYHKKKKKNKKKKR